MDKISQLNFEPIKRLFLENWGVFLVSFVFSITRIRYLDYPLGLLYRQIVKEGFRSYEAIISSENFGISLYIEQPIYVFILEILYYLVGRSPEMLIFLGRILGFFLSAVTLILLYKISDMTFGKIAAIFTAFLYSLSPYVIFMGIGIQRETLMWLFGLTSIFFLIRYIKTDNKKNIILNLFFSLFAILTKFTGIYFLFASLISIILVYQGDRFGMSISFHKRLILVFISLIGISLFSILFVVFLPKGDVIGALQHTIVYQPEALLDTHFWGTAVVYAMLHIPVTTVLLGGVGIILAIMSQEKESIVIAVWTIFSGLEYVFYGYGAIIHEYYILYLLHPIVVLAGGTLYIIYQSYMKQSLPNRPILRRFSSPALLLLLFVISGFFPFFNYIREVKMVAANKPLYEDIRSLGLFLRDSDIQGREIAIILDEENYVWWKYHLILARSYIAKPEIDTITTRNISETINWKKYRAIIGWSDDLSQAKESLIIMYQNLYIYPQNVFLQAIENPISTSFELWFNFS